MPRHQQIYNWFKNTAGRTRRKLEGRPRSAKKAAEKGQRLGSARLLGADDDDDDQQQRYHPTAALAHTSHGHDLTWNSNVANVPNTPNVVQYATLAPTQSAHAAHAPSHGQSHHAGSSTSSPVNQAQTLMSPIQYGPIQPTPTISSSSIGTALSSVSTPAPSHNLNTLLSIDRDTMRESFLQGLDPSTLANMIQSFVAANPSPLPLTPVVAALFEAIASDATSNPFSRDPLPYLKHFLDASSYFPVSIIHAGVSGPLAGPRALQMQIRKHSVWTPSLPPRSAASGNPNNRSTPQQSTSLSDEMQRIALDRQRRKDHIQWARIHASALELNMLGLGRTSDVDNSGYAYAMGRAFSEMTARDAVWEMDEVEWVAGICVLRSVIRTAISGDRRQRDEYDELLRTYEGRWKEIKDEARQALVTVCLFSLRCCDYS